MHVKKHRISLEDVPIGFPGFPRHVFSFIRRSDRMATTPPTKPWRQPRTAVQYRSLISCFLLFPLPPCRPAAPQLTRGISPPTGVGWLLTFCTPIVIVARGSSVPDMISLFSLCYVEH